MTIILSVVFTILGALAAWLIYAMKDEPDTLDNDSATDMQYREFEERGGWLGGAVDHQVSGENDNLDSL